jgi:hypothetical protein
VKSFASMVVKDLKEMFQKRDDGKEAGSKEGEKTDEEEEEEG